MLDENRYMNADVLLISDYRIPKCKPELLKQMSVHGKRVLSSMVYRLALLRMNGQSIDHIYRIEYHVDRKY